MSPLTNLCAPSIRFELPVAWDVLDHPPSPQRRERVEHANAGVLACLLREVDISAKPHPADEQLAEALAPLRVKLDMIIDLLARLSYRDVELPPQREIALAANRIAWKSALPLRPGLWLQIRMYFHLTFREPIIAFAKVTDCIENEPGTGYCIHADLAGMSQHVGEGLSRLAFLAQRRQRAQREK
jgi:hypothetical protein